MSKTVVADFLAHPSPDKYDSPPAHRVRSTAPADTHPALDPSRKEIVSEVETYVLADFPPDTGTVFDLDVASEDSALTFAAGEQWWAYIRRRPERLV